MANSLTFKIINIEDYSLEEYIWECARSFVTLNDVGKPSFPEESSWHQDALKKAEIDLARISSLTEEELIKEADADYFNNIKYYEETLIKKKNDLVKYRKILEKAKQWIPPSPEHIELKNFMLRQLTEAIDWDCNIPYYEGLLSQPKISKEDYFNNTVATLKSDIIYHKDKALRDHKKHIEHVKWIQLLYHNTPYPAKERKL